MEIILSIIIGVLLILLFLINRKRLKYKVLLLAYLRYYQDDLSIEGPTDDKLIEYQKWAVENLVKDFFGSR